MTPRELAEKIWGIVISREGKLARGVDAKLESLLSEALNEAKQEQWAKDVDGIKKQLVAVQERARAAALEEAARAVEDTILVPKELYGVGEMSVLDYRKYVAKEIRALKAGVKA